MPEKEINQPALAQLYREHYTAAYNVLKDDEKQIIQKYKNPAIKLSKSNELFALNWHRAIIEKAEEKYFAVEKPKVEIKELAPNQIVGGDNPPELVSK